jgi:hypothetical protein
MAAIVVVALVSFFGKAVLVHMLDF